MMRLPLPLDADPIARERRGDLARAALFAAVGVLLVLRIHGALTLAMNSDEPQHLHVVWAWTQGLLPYRDVFDNHAPLFQLLAAPLLAWLGERADIVALMRLAMIPLYFGALALTLYIGKTLWSARVGWLAAALAATAPGFFVVSAQFRPDDLWMVLWLACVAVAIAPRLGRYRAPILGFLIGTTLAVSLKTLLLIASAAVAALTVLAIDRNLRRIASMHLARSVAIGFLAALVVPAAFAAFFVGAGAWREAVYGIFLHNLAPELDARVGGLRVLTPLLGYPLAVAGALLWRSRAADRARWRLQCGVLLAAATYLLALYGFWPLVTHQDLLPAIPLAAVGFAAAVFRGSETAPAHRGLALFLAAVCLVNLATTVPLRNELADESNELARVLRLTRPDDYVMDAKGEMIFRRRPVYWAMEDITIARMRDASIVDDISERLAATGTPIVIMDRLPPRDAAFVERNYVPIGPRGGLIRVAGQRLGAVRAGEAVAFDIAVPADYAVVTPDGPARGTLDGARYDGGRRLAAGRHTFVASADSRLALVWAPALERGLGERELFAATER